MNLHSLNTVDRFFTLLQSRKEAILLNPSGEIKNETHANNPKSNAELTLNITECVGTTVEHYISDALPVYYDSVSAENRFVSLKIYTNSGNIDVVLESFQGFIPVKCISADHRISVNEWSIGEKENIELITLKQLIENKKSEIFKLNFISILEGYFEIILHYAGEHGNNCIYMKCEMEKPQC